MALLLNRKLVQFMDKTKALLGILLIFFTVAVDSFAANSTSEILAQKYVKNGGFQVGDGSYLQYRAEERFIPASILKIVTALLALELLGPDYRFSTRLYFDDKNNLYIKGGGDPFLTSEAVLDICQRVKNKFPKRKVINELYLDDSCYLLEGKQISNEHSSEPYDAPNGALAVNFNTLPIRITAENSVQSAESATPLLPIMRYKARLLRLKPGTHRINVASGETHTDLPLRYTGELFQAQLQACGIKVRGGIQKKKVPQGLRPSLIYHSTKELEELLKLLFLYSNNFIANQIFLQLSVQQQNFKEPGTWQKSRRICAAFIRKRLGLIPEDLTMVEGSGLSPDNKITCRAAITILNYFKPWASLLRKRGAILFKSGTMPKSGNYCYAGYFKRKKRYIPYVILLNQQNNTREQLLKALEKRTR